MGLNRGQSDVPPGDEDRAVYESEKGKGAEEETVWSGTDVGGDIEPARPAEVEHSPGTECEVGTWWRWVQVLEMVPAAREAEEKGHEN